METARKTGSNTEACLNFFFCLFLFYLDSEKPTNWLDFPNGSGK